MKIMGSEPLPAVMTVAELADLFGVTDRTIRDLVARGVLQKAAGGTFDARESIRRYTAHLRDVAGARGSAGLTEARERAIREKADQLALRNAAMRRELLPAAEVEATWSEAIRGVRARLLGVPGRCQQRLPHLAAPDAAAIDREIRDALTELGNGQPGG